MYSKLTRLPIIKTFFVTPLGKRDGSFGFSGGITIGGLHKQTLTSITKIVSTSINLIFNLILTK